MSEEKEQAPLLDGASVERVFEALSGVVEPHCELNHGTALELLVAVVLSAQATDESVNRVTPGLWRDCRCPADYVALGEERLGERIRSIGLWRSKARSLVGLCRRLDEAFGGEVPSTREALMSLPGVGRKTANVVLNVWFRQPTLAVDTHVFRVANRIGLVRESTPEAVEEALLRRVPARWLVDAHHYLLLHGTRARPAVRDARAVRCAGSACASASRTEPRSWRLLASPGKKRVRPMAFSRK